MKGRTWLRFFTAGIVAVVVTIGLFGLAWYLANERSGLPEITDTVNVNLVTLPLPETPEPEVVREPEKPEPKPQLDLVPDLLPPALDLPTDLDVGVVIDLSDISKNDLAGGRYIFDSGDLDQPPLAVFRVPPPYPFKARQREIEGTVRFKLLIREDGTVGDVVILEAKPEGLFDDSVLNTVPKWKFSPGKIDGRAVSAWVVTAVRFDLD